VCIYMAAYTDALFWAVGILSFALSIYAITFANIHQHAETGMLLVLYNSRGEVLTS
jgi:hypothetical protein